MGVTADQYARQLKALLPPGRLWAKRIGSWLSNTFLAIGDEFVRVHNRALALLEEWDPRTTDELLEDWERLLGLPDDCDEGTSPTTQERRNAVVQKLISRGGQSPQYYIDLAAALGVTVTVDEFQYPVLRAGFLAGDLCYGEQWAHAWTVNIPPDTSRTLVDASGNGKDLTATGAVTFEASTDAAFSYLARFPGGTGIYLSSAEDAFDFAGTNPLTVEFHFVPTVLASVQPVALASASLSQWFFSLNAAGSLTFTIRQSDGLTRTAVVISNLVAGTRYHVAGIYTGSLVRLFIDGVEQTASSATTGPVCTFTHRRLYVGRAASGTTLTGTIDDLRISNVARYASGFTPPASPHVADANTLALYHFDALPYPGLECRIERAAPAQSKVLFNYS